MTVEKIATCLATRFALPLEQVQADMTQDKLLALTRWIGSAPGFALTYPDLESALKLTASLPVAS